MHHKISVTRKKLDYLFSSRLNYNHEFCPKALKISKVGSIFYQILRNRPLKLPIFNFLPNLVTLTLLKMFFESL